MDSDRIILDDPIYKWTAFIRLWIIALFILILLNIALNIFLDHVLSTMALNISSEELLGSVKNLSILTLISVFLVFVVVIVINEYNFISALQEKIDKIKYDIHFMEERFIKNLLPSLDSIVDKYSSKETSMHENISKHRNISGVADAKIIFNAIVEAYPEIKSQPNVMRLQEDMTNVSHEINQLSQKYSDLVLIYNTVIRRIPTVFYVGILGFRKIYLS